MASDETLYQEVRKGNMGAFDTLYSRYEKRLFGFISRYLHKREDAEEIFHEAFMGVLESREVHFDKATFSTWLYRIARNKCLNRLRSMGRHARFVSELSNSPEHLTVTSATSASASPTESHWLTETLGKAVAKLSMPLAEVYHLRSAGMSYEAMAAILDAPLGTVKSRISEMHRQLRKEMEIWIAD